MSGEMNLATYFKITASFLKGEMDQQSAALALFGADGCSGRDARALTFYRDLALGVALQAVFPRVKSVVDALKVSGRDDVL